MDPEPIVVTLLVVDVLESLPRALTATLLPLHLTSFEIGDTLVFEGTHGPCLSQVEEARP